MSSQCNKTKIFVNLLFSAYDIAGDAWGSEDTEVEKNPHAQGLDSSGRH